MSRGWRHDVSDGVGLWATVTDDGSTDVHIYDDEIDGLLEAMTADGPVFSADGSLAVIRTDPEASHGLREIAEDLWCNHGIAPDDYQLMLRIAALLAAPAPADPEEDGDG